MNDINSLTVCSGDQVLVTPFRRNTDIGFPVINIPAMIYPWEADNNYAAVGLSNQRDTGDIPAFTAINNTTAPITTTITVTPQIGKCIAYQADRKTRTITVNPKPVLSSGMTKSICSGDSVNYEATSATDATTFLWSRGVLPAGFTTSDAGNGSASAMAPAGSSIVWYDVPSGGASSSTAPSQPAAGVKTVCAVAKFMRG
jgi:hypothetical protein